MTKTLLVMAGGTGGHKFGCGRASRLTFVTLTLAYAEDVSARSLLEASGDD